MSSTFLLCEASANSKHDLNFRSCLSCLRGRHRSITKNAPGAFLRQTPGDLWTNYMANSRVQRPSGSRFRHSPLCAGQGLVRETVTSQCHIT